MAYKDIQQKNLTDQQKRVLLVLERLMKEVEESEAFAEVFSDDLDDTLDDILHQDGFGTEGQSDPRGDFRNGEWSMRNVEGYDD